MESVGDAPRKCSDDTEKPVKLPWPVKIYLFLMDLEFGREV